MMDAGFDGIPEITDNQSFERQHTFVSRILMLDVQIHHWHRFWTSEDRKLKAELWASRTETECIRSHAIRQVQISGDQVLILLLW